MFKRWTERLDYASLPAPAITPETPEAPNPAKGPPASVSQQPPLALVSSKAWFAVSIRWIEGIEVLTHVSPSLIPMHSNVCNFCARNRRCLLRQLIEFEIAWIEQHRRICRRHRRRCA